MSNRLKGYWPDPAPEPLLKAAHGIKLELLRYQGDDDRDVDVLISYEVHGTLTEDDAPLLAKLLAEFRPAGKAGAQ